MAMGEHGAVLGMALREAVTNVLRHSEAAYCRIAVENGKAKVRLTVENDGHGGMLREGAGLSGMRACLTAAGGSLQVDGGTTGTRLVAMLPVARP